MNFKFLTSLFLVSLSNLDFVHTARSSSTAAIDNCSTNNGGCDHVCSIVGGRVSCSCNNGYRLMADRRGCQDIDECSTSRTGCDQLCTYAHGTSTCGCYSGYQLQSNGRGCQDINECETNNGNCSHSCTNTPGGFFCSCNSGYHLFNGWQCQVCNLDLAFVVDTSGSIGEGRPKINGLPDNFLHILNFMKMIVLSSPSGTRFASVSFSKKATVNFYFNEAKSDVMAAIDDISYSALTTNTSGALRLLRQDVFSRSRGDRPGSPNVCLIITDGVSNVDVRQLPIEIQRLKSLSTKIIAVGIAKVNDTEMKSMVTHPDTDYFYFSNFPDLQKLYNLVLDQTCRILRSEKSRATTAQPISGADTSSTVSKYRNATTTVSDSSFCKLTPLGTEYNGTLNTTRSGKICMAWSTNGTHGANKYGFTSSSNYVFPDGTDLDAQNFCRNPDRDPGGPWCITSHPDEFLTWEYCAVMNCLDYISDECPTYKGGCAQVCSNTPGSFTCSCRTGYQAKADGHGCQVEEFLEGPSRTWKISTVAAISTTAVVATVAISLGTWLRKK